VPLVLTIPDTFIEISIVFELDDFELVANTTQAHKVHKISNKIKLVIAIYVINQKLGIFSHCITKKSTLDYLF